MAKRVMATWAVVAVVFFLAGGCSGYALCTHINRRTPVETEIPTDGQQYMQAAVFGIYDGHETARGAAIEWDGAELDFEPLECGLPDSQQEFLYYLCYGYGLDFPLALAVIQQESGFEPEAVSRTNDYGLMQINIRNHEWLTDALGLEDFLDPYQNMQAGCFVLRKLFEKYQDTDKVLMAYNMGERGAARLWEEGIYETNYTSSVLTVQKQFYDQMEGGVTECQ